MRVTDISRPRRGRCEIITDDGFRCVLHVDILTASGIGAGVELELERLEELCRESDRKFARERALTLLSRQSYTEKALYGKLLAVSGEQEAAAAVARMIELGLVDDRDYARRYAAAAMESKGFSPQRTALELMKKGIDRDIAEEIITSIEHDPELAIARVILKKYPGCFCDEKAKAKAINGLLRLGYRYGDIRAALRNLEEDRAYYDAEEQYE